jgi:hypothetical protein
MSVLVPSIPTFEKCPIDDLIIEGKLDEALDLWNELRSRCTARHHVRNNLIAIRERIEYKLQRAPATITQNAEKVQESLDAFYRQAKLS